MKNQSRVGIYDGCALYGFALLANGCSAKICKSLCRGTGNYRIKEAGENRQKPGKNLWEKQQTVNVMGFQSARALCESLCAEKCPIHTYVLRHLSKDETLCRVKEQGDKVKWVMCPPARLHDARWRIIVDSQSASKCGIYIPSNDEIGTSEYW